MAAPKKDSLAERKSKLLESLARGYGITEGCKILGVSRNTYYRWSRKDAAFKADASRILSDPAHRERMLSAAATTKVDPAEQWYHTFARVYRTTGDRNEAAEMAGIKPGQVVCALDKHHDEYNEAFDSLMADAEIRQMWRIEDAALKKAEHDGGMQKFILATRMKAKYGQTGMVPQQTNIFWFNQEGESAAQQTMRELFGGSGPPAEIHAGPVIDGDCTVTEP